MCNFVCGVMRFDGVCCVEMGVAGEGCVVQWWGLALAWLKEKLSEAAFDDIFRGVSLMLSSEKAFR